MLLQSMQQLLAKNREAKEEHANRQQKMSTADQMCQTTMTQCFGSSSSTEPPPPADPPPAEGYTHVTVDGQQYLVNEMTQAIMRVPPKNVSVSEKARSMSPLNLARESFEVTISVRKFPSKRTVTAQASNNLVLSENIGSGSKDKIVYA